MSSYSHRLLRVSLLPSVPKGVWRYIDWETDVAVKTSKQRWYGQRNTHLVVPCGYARSVRCTSPLVFQSEGHLHVVRSGQRWTCYRRLQARPKQQSFQQPKGDMNMASSCPTFCHLSELNNHTNVRDETMFLKVIIETTDIWIMIVTSKGLSHNELRV